MLILSADGSESQVKSADMTNTFWENKKVVVTGGAGFIGSHVSELLVSFGARVTILDDLSNANIRNISKIKDSARFIKGDAMDISVCKNAFKNQEILINMVAKVGGIEYNRTHQADMFYDNALLELIPLKAAQVSGITRVLMVSSACVYPHEASTPTPESEGFLNDPEPTNLGYGWAKRMGEIAARVFSDQYGMDVAVVRPYNCYGPRDHFEDEKSHVIPALIKRVLSGENPVIVWGTGAQTRSFLYVEDFARGIVLSAEKLKANTPINLGSDEEITMLELIDKIKKISNTSCEIILDTSKPNGSPRRKSDNTLSQKLIGFRPTVSLDEGLKRTITWYKQHL